MHERIGRSKALERCGASGLTVLSRRSGDEREARQVSARTPGATRSFDDISRSWFAREGLPQPEDVRIHYDEESARAAEELNARAFTVGREIFFGRGEYAPHHAEGQRLIAHEMAHVAQQSRTRPVISRFEVDPGLEPECQAKGEPPATFLRRVLKVQFEPLPSGLVWYLLAQDPPPKVFDSPEPRNEAERRMRDFSLVREFDRRVYDIILESLEAGIAQTVPLLQPGREPSAGYLEKHSEHVRQALITANGYVMKFRDDPADLVFAAADHFLFELENVVSGGFGQALAAGVRIDAYDAAKRVLRGVGAEDALSAEEGKNPSPPSKFVDLWARKGIAKGLQIIEALSGCK